MSEPSLLRRQQTERKSAYGARQQILLRHVRPEPGSAQDLFGRARDARQNDQGENINRAYTFKVAVRVGHGDPVIYGIKERLWIHLPGSSRGCVNFAQPAAAIRATATIIGNLVKHQGSPLLTASSGMDHVWTMEETKTGSYWALWSGRRESNPRLLLGRQGHYHYATPAETWAGLDLNQRSAFARQIYSLVPLTTRPPTHEVSFNLWLTRVRYSSYPLLAR